MGSFDHSSGSLKDSRNSVEDRSGCLDDSKVVDAAG